MPAATGDSGAATGPFTVRQPQQGRDSGPKVWLLLGKITGDNAQVLALAEALGWPAEAKYVRCRRRKGFRARPGETRYQPRLIEGGRPLTPPWPDMVIGIGGLGARTGNWIKRQSGGRTLHVQLGRIDGPYRQFDLIVSTPQYWLATADNLIHLTLPIVKRDVARLKAAAAIWAPRLADLPRPWTALLVGGPSNPIRFGAAEAEALIPAIEPLMRARGGSLLIATGPRTPVEVTQRLADWRLASKMLFPFTRSADGPATNGPAANGRGAENPYSALLAMADRFIVTSDSVSMLADACWSGRPVELFELPVAAPRFLGLWWLDPLRWLRRRRRRRGLAGLAADALDRVFDGLIRSGWVNPGRDVPALIARLKQSDLVRSIGSPEAAAPQEPISRHGPIARDLLIEELRRVLARIASLEAHKAARSA